MSRIFRVSALVLISWALYSCASAPDAPPVPPDEEEETAGRYVTPEDRLAAMTLREKIAQRFIIYVPRGFGEDNRSREYVEMVRKIVPAGMIVYPWNFRDRQDLLRLTAKLQRFSRYNVHGGSLLIAADQEGGRVAAYRFPDMPRFPSAADMARQATLSEGPDSVDEEYLRSQGYMTGRDLQSLGINMNFAPVVDLTDRQDHSIIGDRSWGNDPERVARFAAAYVTGMNRSGVISTVKHFPGHGVTRIDSHGTLPVVDMSRETLTSREITPFAAAIEAEVPAVMTAHILFPHIDPEFPVTISDIFLQDILRDQLGFQGVVVSDGLSMGALADNYTIDEVLQRAFLLDVDLILLHDRYDFRDILDRTEDLLAAGGIHEADIDRGVLRILKLKERYGLLQ